MMESGSAVLGTLLICIFLPNGILSLNSTCNETASTPPCNVSSTASTNISMTSSDDATSIIVMSSLTSDMMIDTSPSTMEPGSGSGDTVSQLVPIDTSSAETQASSATPIASPIPTATAPSPSTAAANTSTPTTMPPTSVPPTTSSSTTSSSSSSPSTSGIVTDATSMSTSDSSPVESGSPILGVVIGCVMVIFLGILLVAVMVIIYCCRTRYCGNGYTRKKSFSFELEERGNGRITSTTQLFTHLDDEDLVRVSLDGLLKHVEELAEDDGYNAEEEYNAAREMDPDPNTNHACLSSNEGKNRYINILARDDTRVILKVGKGSDYINANYIEGFNCEREYIACQGPLPDTVIDFWKMIWEQNSTFIVMVTNPTENGMVKCESYWPPLSAMQYGNYHVKVESELLYPEFIIRQFTLIFVSNKNRKEEGRRSVTQFHFSSWPDFGVPQDPSSMLKFVRCIRSHMTQNSTTGPVVVHCSAGVGRTGTFIAIDILTQKIAEAKRTEALEEMRLSVQEVVCKMRAQRGNMVQTSAQYLFIYNSLLRVFTHGRTDIKQENLKEQMVKLTTPISGDSGKTWLDKEFDHVMNVKLPPDSLSTVACEDYNESKNRDMDNIPFDHNRVTLEGKDNDEDDYVNASHIEGYYNRVEFICTDHPLQQTRTQFWTMLVERSVDVIVVFGPIKDPEDRYWPEEKEILRLGEDLIIVGEEVDSEDEEEEEKGRDGDTEEEEEKERKEKKEDRNEKQVSCGHEIADGASSLEAVEKILEKCSGEESIKLKEGSGNQKEDDAANGLEKEKNEKKEKVEEQQKTEEKKEEKKAEEEQKLVEEEQKAEEKQKVEEKEEKQHKTEEDKKEEEEQKVEEKSREDILTEMKELIEEPTSGEQQEAGEAHTLDSKEKNGSEDENKKASETEKTKGRADEKKEDTIELVESKTDKSVGAVGVDTEAKEIEQDIGAKDQCSGTYQGNVKSRKKSTSEKEMMIIIRNFTVTLEETAQPVKMYHMVGWPTEGAPEAASPMLQLVQKSRDQWKNTGFNSILLHTATGVKNEVSGVYCGLCILLRMLQIEQEVDVVTTMERLRQQRPGILRNKDVFMYIYKVLDKAVK